MFTALKRIFHYGWINFSRDIGPNIAAIFILVIVISLVTSLYLFQKPTQFFIQGLEEKVDVTVYFEEDSSDEEILKISQRIAKLPEVKSTEYISKEEALGKFTERHRQDPVLIESLEELGANPFLASLNIRASEPSQYQSIITFLEKDEFKPLIQKIDYYQKKPVMGKLLSITFKIKASVIIFSIILAIISIIVAFNQIQLSIHNSKQEIKVMRLVGASNFFLRGPFIVQGIIIGILAGLITALIFGAILYGLNPKIESFAPGLNLFGFFISNLSIIFLIQLATGIGIGVFASLLATRKYLKV